jgi:pimeloyl-ACP methyl ester carboxylesterase
MSPVRMAERGPGGASGATVVLVHGAGHTAPVWEQVQAVLAHRSLAVDLPGRADRVAGIADVGVDDAVASVAADVDAACPRVPVVLVGHSAGGVVLPGVAARLGARVGHLVFVAGLCAPHGQAVIDTVRPDAASGFSARLDELRAEFAGCMLDPDPPVVGMRAIDETTARGIDSLNYMQQIVSWDGVPATTPRTFVRCLRDRIQPRALQSKLVANCGASEVVDIDCGHTPALAAPAELAAVVDRIAERTATSAAT